MSVTSGSLLDIQTSRGIRGARSRFFLWAALVVGSIVVTGFTKSYFDRLALGETTLAPLVRIHAGVMAGWFVLFIAQAALIAGGRPDLHRRVGIAGVALAVALLSTSMMVTWHAAAVEVARNKEVFFRMILGFNGLSLVVFAAAFGAAIALRRRPQFHKRFMLLASLCLLGPAFGRLIQNPYAVIGAVNATILVCVVMDTVRNGRLHPVLGWGGLSIVALYFWAVWAVQTPTWIRLATALVS
ncbi:MAG TPA: hypothetical protein VFO44_16625 [Steroidobacteraceae bacterium]|nr:hypothetical protein [Steroidobacteraceae bacterium]